jgi:outer membrane protein assembly factor BamD (BamD/ComL family)
MHKSGVFFWLISLVWFACQTKPASSEKEKMAEEIQSLAHVVLVESQDVHLDQADALLKMYVDYSNKYREDSLSSVFLLDGAQLAASMGKYHMAIQLLMNYAEHPKAAKLDYATYMVGYEYDAHLHQPAKAKQYYQAVVDRYPNSTWAGEAKKSMKWVGMSDQEIISNLEHQQTEN